MSRETDGPGIPVLAGIVSVLGFIFSLLLRMRRLGPLDFWWGMGLIVAGAAAVGLAGDRGYARRLREDAVNGLAAKVGLGLLSAGILYGVFAAGRAVALQIFSFAGQGIDSVYALKSG